MSEVSKWYACSICGSQKGVWSCTGWSSGISCGFLGFLHAFLVYWLACALREIVQWSVDHGLFSGVSSFSPAFGPSLFSKCMTWAVDKRKVGGEMCHWCMLPLIDWLFQIIWKLCAPALYKNSGMRDRKIEYWLWRLMLQIISLEVHSNTCEWNVCASLPKGTYAYFSKSFYEGKEELATTQRVRSISLCSKKRRVVEDTAALKKQIICFFLHYYFKIHIKTDDWIHLLELYASAE